MWAPVTAIHSIWMLIFDNQAALKIPYNTAIKTTDMINKQLRSNTFDIQ